MSALEKCIPVFPSQVIASFSEADCKSRIYYLTIQVYIDDLLRLCAHNDYLIRGRAATLAATLVKTSIENMTININDILQDKEDSRRPLDQYLVVKLVDMLGAEQNHSGCVY
jgi:hypothetical protein